MKQPSVYSKEQILDAAIQVIRRSGWNAATTRMIAKELGSSTMPIYSQFRSREKLEEELRQRTRQMLVEYQQRQYSQHPLLNAAFGYVKFARDERNIFRLLFMEPPAGSKEAKGGAMIDSFKSELGEEALRGTILEQLPAAGQSALVEHSWIFTHGLAMMVNAGGGASFHDDKVMELLMNAGQAFFLLESSKEKMDPGK